MPALEALTERLYEVTKERREALSGLEEIVIKVAKLEMDYDLAYAKGVLENREITPADVRKATVDISLGQQKLDLLMAKASKMGLEKRQETLGKELDALRSLFSLAKEEARMGGQYA